MARRTTIGAFSLPSARGCLSPSALADQLASYGRAGSFLAGALFASLIGTMWLTYLCLLRAEVIPFVADGGVFGCEVRTGAQPPSSTGKTEP